jgi:hypothetical protein
MAITAGKQVRPLAEGRQDFANGKANDIVYAGGIVMLDSSGRAINGAAATGCIGVGVALTNRDLDRYDSTGLADGALKVRWEEGVFPMKNSGSQPFLSSDQPGIIVYIEDNETASKTSQSSTLSVAGFFHHLDADGVWVMMSKEIGATALPLITATDLSAAHLAGSETFTGVKTFASGADPLFAKEAAHTLKVADTTTAATAGGALTIAAGKSGTSGAGGALALIGGAGTTNANGGAASLDTGAKNGSGTDATLSLGATNAAAITLGRAGKLITRQGPIASGAATDTIADPGTGVAIPVTQSGVCAITIGSSGAETNTLADPTFMGQMITIVADTVGSGTRAVTAASVINGANNTVMTFNAVRDQIVLQAITVAGALKWAVLLNISVTLS